MITFLIGFLVLAITAVVFLILIALPLKVSIPIILTPSIILISYMIGRMILEAIR